MVMSEGFQVIFFLGMFVFLLCLHFLVEMRLLKRRDTEECKSKDS